MTLNKQLGFLNEFQINLNNISDQIDRLHYFDVLQKREYDILKNIVDAMRDNSRCIVEDAEFKLELIENAKDDRDE